ncbi:unnamed protein product [Rodentolepis nana]|uniref:FRMD7 n=1 Tax=Rodentolepis nana TaxID=102285 RepID=A0A0R3T352_RODNA|nr:unnamed protein product [Rodentolepis nana]
MDIKREEYNAKTSTIPAIMTRDSGSAESPLPGERPCMQLLTLPTAALSRSRGCSIASYRSEDAISNLSLGSLLQPEFDEEFLSDVCFQADAMMSL